MEFQDRTLKCSDCSADFIFTAGEQLFFADRQFKNDPKRCKLCRSKRVGSSKQAAAGPGLPLSRTETRTECSACGVETTVPFKPTQGRPVLCRQCFQMKRVPTAMAAVANMDSGAAQVHAAVQALEDGSAMPAAMAAAGGASAAESMEMIANAPNEVTGEPVSAEMVLAAAVAPQA